MDSVLGFSGCGDAHHLCEQHAACRAIRTIAVCLPGRLDTDTAQRAEVVGSKLPASGASRGCQWLDLFAKGLIKVSIRS